MCREFELQKHGQREFNKKMAEKVDKFTQESETKVTIVVTIVLEMCEQVAEQLRKYGARPHQYSVFSNVCPWCFKGVCVFITAGPITKWDP